MNRKPLIGLCEAYKRYGYKAVERPSFVKKGYCQWCGKKIRGNRRKSFCCKECSDTYHRLVTWGRTRSAYSNNIVWRDNLTCCDCGMFLAFKNEHGVYVPWAVGTEVHHIIPVSQGGEDNPNNLITLCHSCHLKRHQQLRSETDEMPNIKSQEQSAGA